MSTVEPLHLALSWLPALYLRTDPMAAYSAAVMRGGWAAVVAIASAAGRLG